MTHFSGVLRAADGHVSMQRSAALDYQTIHELFS
jgi:hypothetical protein